jgi:hypothetical protein
VSPAKRGHLPLPPVRTTRSGRVRRIGVELELGGLALDAAARVVADHVGGPVEQHGRYEKQVRGDVAGPWGVELDFAWLKELGRRQRDPDAALTPLREAGEDVLREASEWLVPVEVVSPPLSMERLPEVDELIERLRRSGARGTGGGFFYAFGLQLNPEMPDTDAETVLRYLRAFLCLADWLEKRAEVDLARRLTVFVDPFPKEYVRRVVDPGYRPDLTQLIDDYLALNPTRNRALDFLPLFLHLDEGRVRSVVEDPRVKPRPALHYRLPNCEIDAPGWGLGPIWRDWLQVEHLAAEPHRLRAVCDGYAGYLDRFLSSLLEDWHQEVGAWLKASEDL